MTPMTKLTLLCLALIAILQISLQQTCKQNGEYCVLHSECCSKSCVSFLYKCTKNLQEQYQPAKPVIVDRVSEGESPTLEDILAAVFGPQIRNTQSNLSRDVNKSGTTTTTAATTTNTDLYPVKDCGRSGDACNSSDDCCNGRCLTYAHRCVL